MKKVLIHALALAMLLSMAACGRQAETVQVTPQPAQEPVASTTPAEESATTEEETTEEATEEIPVEVGVFDLERGTVLLNSGYEMPVLGIGCFMLSNEQAENSVYWALRDGYRLIDTARIYGNEAGVGRGIRRAIDEGFVTREEIFVTTKMWTSDFDNGDAAVDASLERLGLDYIDLMILHHSQPWNDVDAYQAMERAVEAGKLRSIGLSNYYEPEDFDRLVNATAITPAILQNETHTLSSEHRDEGAHCAVWHGAGILVPTGRTRQYPDAL